MNQGLAVRSMSALRAIAGSIEIVAAVFMLKGGSVNGALRINAALAVLGPVFMFAVSAIGLLGISSSISPAKVILITAGAALIFFGTVG